MAVAVCGPKGELILFLRMDAASPAASLIAQNKTYTSACDRKSTREMGEFTQGNNRPPACGGEEKITGFGGGLAMIVDEKVIGGNGLSACQQKKTEELAMQ